MATARECQCRKPVPHENPRHFGTCVKCGCKIKPGTSGVHIETCARCHHNFDTEAEGSAGISFLYGDGGWMGDRFKQVRLCPPCRDSLRSWVGLAPVLD